VVKLEWAVLPVTLAKIIVSSHCDGANAVAQAVPDAENERFEDPDM
jgi:hypothetical protein